MRLLKSFLFIFLISLCLPLAAQVPAYDDMTMESDETESTYRASGKNFVFLRSKRGTSGMNHTSAGDSIKSFPVNEIVLVFTEVNESAFDEREDANRERWENLMKTYPEYFQANTTYKSLCQCKIGGDSVAFKKAQGFYVYFTGKAPPPKTEEPVVKAEPKVEIKNTEPKNVTKEPALEAAKTTAKTPEPVKTEEPKVAKIEPVKTEEPKVAKTETAPVKETPKEIASEPQEEPVAENKPVKKNTAPVGKPRRAKDPKACRPACYESGDEDLNNFFKTSLTFTKKEKRKIKNVTSVVKIQLNVDGSIKKVAVTGEDEVLNKRIEGAVNGMNKWNAAVKNGVTVKSEVKITLKYDKPSKGLKPMEVALIPRPGPKCKCMSDSEMFD